MPTESLPDPLQAISRVHRSACQLGEESWTNKSSTAMSSTLKAMCKDCFLHGARSVLAPKACESIGMREVPLARPKALPGARASVNKASIAAQPAPQEPETDDDGEEDPTAPAEPRCRMDDPLEGANWDPKHDKSRYTTFDKNKRGEQVMPLHLPCAPSGKGRFNTKENAITPMCTDKGYKIPDVGFWQVRKAQGCKNCNDVFEVVLNTGGKKRGFGFKYKHMEGAPS